jgi:long-chain fatty acid transport protein
LLGLIAGAALAAGYYTPDAGIVALGRGGAVCAGTEDQYAQYYNPAGLVRVRAATFYAGLAELKEPIAFTRVDADGTRSPVAHNQAGWFGIPELGFATPLPHDLALAVGFFAPYAPGVVFAADGPQRYAITDSAIAKFDVGPSLAWRPVPEFAVGAGVSWQVLTLGEGFDATTSGTDDPLGDVAVDARMVDRFTPGFSVGVLVEPVPAVSIGASFVPRSRFASRGSGSLDFTGNGLASSLDQVRWTDDDIALDLALPAVIRVGVAVRPVPALEVELDGVWEGWRALGDIVVTDIDLTVTGTVLGSPTEVPVPHELALPSGFQDAGSVRLGGEWTADDRVRVRAGGLFETSSLPEPNASVALVDTPKVQVGAGTSVVVGHGFALDAGAAWVRFARLHVTDSTVTQLDFGDSTPRIVGNGDLAADAVTLGLAVRWAPARRREPVLSSPTHPG